MSDVIELQRGHDLPSDERRTGTVPIIGSFGVTGFHDTARYAGPGVGIGRSGASIGTATFVRDDYWPLNTCLFVKDFKGNDPRWVYRLLDQIDFAAFNSGSAQPSLNRNFLRSIPVGLPSLTEQQAIAEVLGALDDKIAANTALTATADSVLATEFRARLHRAEAHDKELGAIANVVLGGTPSRARLDYWTDGTIPWLNSGAVNATRIVEPSELITAKALANSATKLMPASTTLLAITGATLGQIARLEMEASGNQSIVGVWSADVALNTWLYYAIQARLDDLLARATGAAQQHVSKGDVEQLAVPIPSRDVLEAFAGVATPLLELAAIAERENRTLAATRDALLPQLMSGKLRVRDAEAAAPEAGD
ncbi:type I restriction enzyme S subunit [Agromyces hippuratus]|uniref:Type I restriction enzyme S subunit n=1 Tax=Agromyces hippuratus TaxID=286438 RepID=A0A852X181_9MICO|nr:type I restriction enzyme S subunit [Agromyces hippuratus]